MPSLLDIIEIHAFADRLSTNRPMIKSLASDNFPSRKNRPKRQRARSGCIGRRLIRKGDFLHESPHTSALVFDCNAHCSCAFIQLAVN